MSDLAPAEMLELIRRESPLGEKSLVRLRAALTDFYLRYSQNAPLRVSEIRIGECPAFWVDAGQGQGERTLLFFHGGGFTVGSTKDHLDLCGRLAFAARARALSLDYRLAPEHPFPTAAQDCLEACKWLLSQGMDPAKLGLIGISAGGGLALTSLLGLRQAGLPLPAAALLMSPATDLRFPGQSTITNQDSDWIGLPRLKALKGAYLGQQDPAQPMASPVLAELSGLPPMLIQVGGGELLLDDNLAFAAKAQAAGVDVRLDRYPGMFHCWQVFADVLAEGRRAISQAGDFLAARLAA